MLYENPWVGFSLDTYVRHMGHKAVRQIEMLARIVGEQFELVAGLERPVVAFAGITDGNGLDNIPRNRCRAIIGLDINTEFLNACAQMHSDRPELELYQIDLMAEKERAARLLRTADLVIANLLIEHIQLANFIDIIGGLSKPIVSASIQLNPDGTVASHSGYESEFEDILQGFEEFGALSLSRAMREIDYQEIGQTEYILPNQKIFMRLDYQRHV